MLLEVQNEFHQCEALPPLIKEAKIKQDCPRNIWRSRLLIKVPIIFAPNATIY